MTPTQHISNNRVLGAPRDWDQNGPVPCGALAVTDHETNGLPAVASFWRPDAAELAALNAGGLVMLSVAGRTHPPLMLQVTVP